MDNEEIKKKKEVNQHGNDPDRTEEEELNDELRQSFPASDPPSRARPHNEEEEEGEQD